MKRILARAAALSCAFASLALVSTAGAAGTFVQPVTVRTEDGRALTLLSRDLSKTGIRLIGASSLLGRRVEVEVVDSEAGKPARFVVRVLWTCAVGDGLFSVQVSAQQGEERGRDFAWTSRNGGQGGQADGRGQVAFVGQLEQPGRQLFR